jgi:hypothetical protein
MRWCTAGLPGHVRRPLDQRRRDGDPLGLARVVDGELQLAG